MRSLALPATFSAIDEPDGKAAIGTGDRAVFEFLMRRHERLVLVTALRLLGNLADAQDASQEVFLRLYRNLARVGTVENLAGWLYRVTVNVCRDVRRRSDAGVPVDGLELASSSGDPQHATAESERRAALNRSLRILGEKERAALVLRDLEGLSTTEVAHILGVSEATVRSQVSKARVKMKSFLERYFRRRT